MLQILTTLDQHHQDRAVLFIRVLCSYATAVTAGNDSESRESSRSLSSRPLVTHTCATGVPSADEIKRYFDEYRKQKETANMFTDSVPLNGENEDNDVEGNSDNVDCEFNDVEQKKNIPDHIKLTTEVTKNIVTYIQHRLAWFTIVLLMKSLLSVALCCCVLINDFHMTLCHLITCLL